MKAICFFVKIFLLFSITAQAQQVKDSTTTANKQKIIDSLRMAVPLRVNTLPPNYYNTQLGFFCKKELQIQKAVKLPIVFRLGSAAYTDKLEGKIKY
jgi:hypothetical protein